MPVEIIENLKGGEDDDCYGIFIRSERSIRLRAGMNPITAWNTLWHETIHVWLWDAGVSTDDKNEERVCDALASQMVARMLASEHVDVGSVREA